MEDWCNRIRRHDAAIWVGVGLFTDCGAWHGYCRSGEFLEVWALPRKTIPLRIYSETFKYLFIHPDRIEGPGLKIAFADDRSAIIEVDAPVLHGDSDHPLRTDKDSLVVETEDGVLTTRIIGEGEVRIDGRNWELHGNARPFQVQQTFDDTGEPTPLRPRYAESLLSRNRERWTERLGSLRRHFASEEDFDLLVHAAATLIHNWRSPRGGIRHAGVIPSPFAYNGFWAWDSWKHARALALFEPELARDQVRAMFDHQLPDGMIPDTVMVDPAGNNTANTKPPLAAWAVEGILAADGEWDFVEEMLPALLKYMAFWEKRRAPGEELYAYGGDGLTEAKWESGWDNATRFDGARMVDGRDGPIMNVLAVDLNAYIAHEKRIMADFCAVRGRKEDMAAFTAEAERLEGLIREKFFDEATGAFYDLTWPEGNHVPTLTAAAWAPLWTGAASKEQAERMAAHMFDEGRFKTPMPFPTVSRDDPRFERNGYWRGPVWIDQACFAVEALKSYGKHSAAKDALRTIFSYLREHDSFYECYNPFTGAPARGRRPAAAQFSWTAAHLLLASGKLFHT